jgi:hypothetical protein
MITLYLYTAGAAGAVNGRYLTLAYTVLTLALAGISTLPSLAVPTGSFK